MFLFLRYTRFGKAMRAVADNPDLARLKGIDPARIAIVAVFLGAGLFGVRAVRIGLATSFDPPPRSRGYSATARSTSAACTPTKPTPRSGSSAR